MNDGGNNGNGGGKGGGVEASGAVPLVDALDGPDAGTRLHAAFELARREGLPPELIAKVRSILEAAQKDPPWPGDRYIAERGLQLLDGEVPDGKVRGTGCFAGMTDEEWYGPAGPPPVSQRSQRWIG